MLFKLYICKRIHPINDFTKVLLLNHYFCAARTNANKKKFMPTNTSTKGFDKILEDKKDILSCFKEMLSGIEENSLSAFIESLDADDKGVAVSDEKIIQAFGIYFQLMNLIEENAAIQFNRQLEKNDGISAIRGSWGETFKRWKEQGIDQDKMVSMISSLEVSPVLTAHPTEAKRVTILEIHRELYLLLVQNENSIFIM